MEKVFLHGENVVLSRERLTQIKEGLSLGEIEEIHPESFSQKGTGFFERQLFAGRRFLLLEFFEKDQIRQFDLEKFSAFLEGPDRPEGFIVWCGFEVTGSHHFLEIIRQNKFRETKFDISPRVFKLVDAFFEPRRSLAGLYQLAGKEFEWEKEGIFLVQMLIKRTRQLLWLLYEAGSFKKLHPFVQKKLRQSQSGFGQTSTLLKIYRKLSGLEKHLKSRAVDLETHFFLLYESLDT